MRSVTELAIGREVLCRGALCGTVTFVVWDAERGKVTYLVVQPDGPSAARLVPISRVVPVGDWLEFGGTRGEFLLQRYAEAGLFARDGQAGWSDRSDHVLVWDASADATREWSLQAA